MQSDRKETMLLLFKKDELGKDYHYIMPIYTKKSSENKQFISKCGDYANSTINYRDCIECNSLINKMKNNYSRVIAADGFSNSDSIYLILNGDVGDEAFRYLKKKYGRNPSEYEFYRAFAVMSDRVGKNIKFIRKSLFNGFEIFINGNLDEIEWGDFKNLFEVVNKVYKKPISSSGTSNGIDSHYHGINSSPSPKPHSVFLSSSDQLYRKKQDSSYSFDYDISLIDVSRIKNELKKKVIAQDDAIDKIVNNIYFNQRYINVGDDDSLRNKANILLDGPTGTGKTFILEEVAKNLKLPIVITSATNYSSVGYKGSDIDEILVSLLKKTNGDVKLAERGIVVFDEFDKLGFHNSSNDFTMRMAIQHELLAFISGSTYSVEYNGRSFEFDTSKLTIIGMGAFTHLREMKISENEKKYNGTIGFGSTKEESYDKTYTITKDDYIADGLERELVGRFSCLAFTNELDINDLKRILVESKVSPLNQIFTIAEIMNCHLTIDDELIQEIAETAYETNVGARGLIQIVQALKDVIANELISGVKDIHITQEHLELAKRINLRSYHTRSI